MKTIVYRTGQRLTILVAVLLIVTFYTAAAKGHDTPSPKPIIKSEAVKSIISEASLRSSTEAIAENIQEWMAEGSYWEKESSADFESEKMNGNAELKAGNQEDTTTIGDLRSWMNKGCYWKADESAGKE